MLPFGAEARGRLTHNDTPLFFTSPRSRGEVGRRPGEGPDSLTHNDTPLFFTSPRSRGEVGRRPGEGPDSLTHNDIPLFFTSPRSRGEVGRRPGEGPDSLTHNDTPLFFTSPRSRAVMVQFVGSLPIMSASLRATVLPQRSAPAGERWPSARWPLYRGLRPFTLGFHGGRNFRSSSMNASVASQNNRPESARDVRDLPRVVPLVPRTGELSFARHRREHAKDSAATAVLHDQL